MAEIQLYINMDWVLSVQVIWREGKIVYAEHYLFIHHFPIYDYNYYENWICQILHETFQTITSTLFLFNLCICF